MKTELLARKINFSPSDSYHIMTLHLRKDILEHSEPHNVILENVKKELEGYVKSKFKSGSKYSCQIPGCLFTTVNYKKYLSHLEAVHRNSKSKFVCQYQHRCSREFPTFLMLRNHNLRDHTKQTSSVMISQNQQVVELTLLKCAEESCGHQSASSIPVLKKHLYSVHTDKKEEIQCIFCAYRSNITSSLQSHMSRKHKVQSIQQLNSNVVKIIDDDLDERTGVEETEDVSMTTTFPHVEEEEDGSDGHEEDLESNDGDFNEENQEIFIKALAIMINSWMNIKGIAWGTVNSIVQEVFASYYKGAEFTRNKIRSKMLEDGFDVKVIDDALDVLEEEDPFSKARELLEDETKRKNFLFNSFPNVRPLTVHLNSGKGEKPETLQYVPIQDSLKLLLEDQSYIDQKNNDPYFYEEGVIKDVRDGSCYRENPFFSNNPDAVPIVLFQDELELANPLGSGKIKHKILCSYFTTLDIQPALRSKVNSIQLVSLVLSRFWKKHGNVACNKNFVEDLKHLEVEGMKISKPCDKTVKVGLAYIVGDNLGQHSLAEMSASFSSGQICRWCKADYRSVCQEGKSYKGCEEGYEPDDWTVESYNESADKADSENEEGDDTYGIKGHCTFNQLESFHCINQMPPCLGHDVYEGSYSYDIQFCIDYIINKEKLISLENFNKKLKNFQLSERDSKNRPKEFKTRKKNSKYEGNAGSLRVLSRILTIVLSGVLEQSNVGDLIIKLQEVSELITAPKLTVYEIDNIFHDTVVEYLDMRVAAIEELGMSTIKPKHHFLSHYSKLYKYQGPLIQLWAMRMESKHTFMKNCLRTSKNFVNVSKTCATRHQMAQISFSYYGLFPSKFEIPSNALVNRELMKISTDDYLKKFLAKIHPDALIPTHIKIFGTKYEAGMIVVLKKEKFGEMLVGLLRAIAFINGTVFFGCRSFEVKQSRNGFYVSTRSCSDLEIVDVGELADHHPLHRLGTPENFVVALHHYVSASQDVTSEFED